MEGYPSSGKRSTRAPSFSISLSALAPRPSDAAPFTAVAQAREIPGTVHKNENGAARAPSAVSKARRRAWNRWGPIPGTRAREIHASLLIAVVIKVFQFGPVGLVPFDLVLPFFVV